MKSLRSLLFNSFPVEGIGKLIYKNEGVRHLPMGEAPLQKDAQFARIDRRTVFEDQNSQWALLPFGVGYGDDYRFSDCRLGFS